MQRDWRTGKTGLRCIKGLSRPDDKGREDLPLSRRLSGRRPVAICLSLGSIRKCDIPAGAVPVLVKSSADLSISSDDGDDERNERD